jgi:hypothetical protein
MSGLVLSVSLTFGAGLTGLAGRGGEGAGLGTVVGEGWGRGRALGVGSTGDSGRAGLCWCKFESLKKHRPTVPTVQHHTSDY